MTLAAAPVGVDGEGHPCSDRFVGRGILDASGAYSFRGRQGCRPLRHREWIARASGGTHRSRPTVHVGRPKTPSILPSINGPRCPPPLGAAAGTMAVGRGFRHLRMAVWNAGDFARCDGRPRLCPWTPRFWAARRSLARVVGEVFFVRARCGFAAILDVWQETTPQLWRKRPGEHRRHTGIE